MKILVTGGTGFTGSHLVRRLLDRGHRVSVIDFQKGLFYEELKKQGALITLGSVTDKNIVDELVKDCEVVYHLAAAFRQINVSKHHYWDVNVEGTRNLVDAAFRFGVRKYIHCSTIGVYGNVERPPANENSPIAPADYYQLTKYEGERVVQEYVDRGLDAITILPAGIYGPGDSGRFLILFRLVKRGYFLMFGDGHTFYHTVYIDNLLDAFELASEKGGNSGARYIIADGKYYSLNELVDCVARAMGISVRIHHVPFWPIWTLAGACEIVCKPLGISPPLFRRRIDWFRQNRAFDITKAKEGLCYDPKIDLNTGLSIAANWYREYKYI